MKNYLAIAFATALAACGGVAPGGKDQLGFDYQNQSTFLSSNSVTSVTIDVFSDTGGTAQVGTTITPPTCGQPITSSTTGCFDPGLNPARIAATTLNVATAVDATSFTVASNANFEQYEMVIIGSETLQVTGINADGITIATSKATKAHKVGEMVVTAPRFAKFYGYSLQLAGSASPGTDYWITVKYFNGTTQVGLSNLQNVKVISGKVNTLPLSASNTYTTANGVVITASSGFVSYLGLGATQDLSVTALDPSGGTLTYAWAKTGATCAAGSTFSSTSVSNPTFTAQATAGSCTLTVTVSSGNAGIPNAKKSTTVAIANDAVVVANASPPQINQIVISTPNTADATCTLSRAAPGCTGNACWPNVSCQQGFALTALPLSPDNAFASQSYFMNIAVRGSLGASGFNASAPPSVSALVDCPNDKADYPYSKPTDGSSPKPAYTVSFPAGYAFTGPVNGNANEYGSDSYLAEPDFSFGKGAWDEADTYAAGDLVVAHGNIYQSLAGGNVGNDPAEGDWAWVSGAGAIPTPYRTAWTPNWSGTVGWCTITVKLTNQSGGSDSVPVGVYFQ